MESAWESKESVQATNDRSDVGLVVGVGTTEDEDSVAKSSNRSFIDEEEVKEALEVAMPFPLVC